MLGKGSLLPRSYARWASWFTSASLGYSSAAHVHFILRFFGWFGLWDEFGFRDMDILYRDGDDLGETSGVGCGWGPGALGHHVGKAPRL